MGKGEFQKIAEFIFPFLSGFNQFMLPPQPNKHVQIDKRVAIERKSYLIEIDPAKYTGTETMNIKVIAELRQFKEYWTYLVMNLFIIRIISIFYLIIFTE